MPVYEFRCGACGETFEIISSLADREAKAVCPACGDRDV
jgi:putative FmdB family regulatory protein